jgi:hypothetical protein
MQKRERQRVSILEFGFWIWVSIFDPGAWILDLSPNGDKIRTSNLAKARSWWQGSNRQLKADGNLKARGALRAQS